MEAGADPTVFDEIRASCAAVASVADHVRIDRRRLAEFAQELDRTIDDDLDDDPGHTPLGDDESTAAFVITLEQPGGVVVSEGPHLLIAAVN